MTTLMEIQERKLAVETANYWFQCARNGDYPLAERLMFMENAVNHLEGALIEARAQLSTIRRETFIEAMAIAQKYVQRTNSDIAYGIFNEIRSLHDKAQTS